MVFHLSKSLYLGAYMQACICVCVWALGVFGVRVCVSGRGIMHALYGRVSYLCEGMYCVRGCAVYV